MCKVIIDGEIQYAADGTLLSDVLIGTGADVEHPCGGRGVCRKCIVIIDGKEELACQYVIKKDISVHLPENGEIISETGATESGEITENVCFCLDIGTTTLALALVSLDNAKIIKVITRKNPQRVFGADVMTRIDCCRKNGVAALQKAVVSEINSMIADFNLKKTEKLYVSGNATMLHIFFGVDCTAMGVAPYSPVFLAGKTENAENLGIEGAEIAESLPSVAAFVGADVVAGMNFIGMPENGRHNLLIDLGTNAEIVLYDSNSALCTSAAAGPCFEGANISCGMSATDGAIYSYCASETKTVGRMPAKGICGTGLVDIIAELLRTKTIDKTGFMDCEEFEISDGVSLNQSDIRQYQLAKSAVYSAIMTLIEMKNISFGDIEKMYISGGFSAEINMKNAVATGLLPKELAEKCAAVNNSSLLGTVKYACEKNNLSVYTDNAVYVDLSGNSGFSDLFIKNMMFGTD